MSCYLIQLQFDPTKLIRFLHSQGLNRGEDEDLGYGAHAWLKAVFGEMAPKPFRLFYDPTNRRPPKLLGYTEWPHSELAKYAMSFAEPYASQVCNFDRQIDSKLMPDRWPIGKHFNFEVLACPIGRKSRSGEEKDIFLIKADSHGKSGQLERDAIYRNWLEQQCDKASLIESVELLGFRLVHQFRRHQGTNNNDSRKNNKLLRPQALLGGKLAVRDSDNFSRLIIRGIGRHRAFGYGMLLLKPIR